MYNYQLNEPFDLGKNTKWTANQDGWLYLRCRDDWKAIADNDGVIEVTVTAND